MQSSGRGRFGSRAGRGAADWRRGGGADRTGGTSSGGGSGGGSSGHGASSGGGSSRRVAAGAIARRPFAGGVAVGVSSASGSSPVGRHSAFNCAYFTAAEMAFITP